MLATSGRRRFSVRADVRPLSGKDAETSEPVLAAGCEWRLTVFKTGSSSLSCRPVGYVGGPFYVEIHAFAVNRLVYDAYGSHGESITDDVEREFASEILQPNKACELVTAFSGRLIRVVSKWNVEVVATSDEIRVPRYFTFEFDQDVPDLRPNLTLLVGAEQKQLHVHKECLAAASTTFFHMLTSGFREGAAGNRMVELAKEKPDELADLLRFIYHCWEPITDASILYLPSLAEYYDVRFVTELCELWLVENFGTPPPAEFPGYRSKFWFLAMADRFRYSKLEATCKERIPRAELREIFKQAPESGPNFQIDGLATSWHELSDAFRARLLLPPTDNAPAEGVPPQIGLNFDSNDVDFPGFDPDVTLVVGDERTRLHIRKKCLSAASPVFARMMLEIGDSNELPLPSEIPQEMVALLRHVYHCADPISEESVIFLAKLARRYDMDFVSNRCEDWLTRHRDENDRFWMIAVGDWYGFQRLEDMCTMNLRASDPIFGAPPRTEDKFRGLPRAFNQLSVACQARILEKISA